MDEIVEQEGGETLDVSPLVHHKCSAFTEGGQILVVAGCSEASGVIAPLTMKPWLVL
jgi:hypothetical protein